MTPYYEDEWVTLYHGDSREIGDWANAEVLITDPPYGVNYEDRTGRRVINDHDTAAATMAMASWGSRPAVMFANHSSLHGTLALVRQHLGTRVRVMTWHKTNVNGAAPGNPWLADVEFAVCGVKEWPRTPVSALISARRFTGNPAWNASPDAYLHPTQKPIPVMESVVLAMPEGVIADPFAGSGSTLMAAKRLGRRAIGVELDEQYCEIAARRLAQDVLDFEGAS